MALNDTTISKSSFKLLQGKAHTSNAFDLPNEAESSAPTMAAHELFGSSIPFNPNTAVAEGIVVYAGGLTLELDPSSAGKAYFAKITTVVGSALEGKKNPRTGVAYADGDRVGYFVPPKYNAPAETSPTVSYRAILRDNWTEVAPTDAANWYFDYRAGIVVSENNLSLTNGTIDGYVYVGRFVSDAPDGYFDPVETTPGRLDIINRNDGYVGIGDAASQFPNTAFHISGDDSMGVFATVQNTNEMSGALSGYFFKSGAVVNTTKCGLMFERTGSNGRGKLHLANNIEDTATNVLTSDARITINESGDVGISNTSPTATIHAIKTGSQTGLRLDTYANLAAGSRINSYFARGTEDAPLLVQNNDQVSELRSVAYDGALFRRVGSVTVEMDGVPADGDVPSRMVFKTTPAGTSTLSEVVRLTNAGFFGINTATTTAHRLHVKDANLPTDRNLAKLESTYGATSGIITGLDVSMQYGSGNPIAKAARISLIGHVGSERSLGLEVESDARSTSTINRITDGGGNRGLSVLKTSISSVDNDAIGIRSTVYGSRYNFGVLGATTSASNDPKLNVGLWGAAFGATNNVGVFASVGASATEQVVPNASAALLANNGTSTSDIFICQDDGYGVFSVKNDGVVTVGAVDTPSAKVHIKNSDLTVALRVERSSGASLMRLFDSGAVGFNGGGSTWNGNFAYRGPTDSANPQTATFERVSTTDTAGVKDLLKLVARTFSASVVQGFGPSLSFGYEDDLGETELARIAGLRSVTRDTGEFRFAVNDGSGFKETARGTSDGYWMFGSTAIAPTSHLDIYGTSGVEDEVFASIAARTNNNDITTAGLRFKTSTTTLGSYKGGIFFHRRAGSGRGDLVFAVNNDTGPDDVSVSNEVMRVNRLARVGIGVSEPSSKLTINNGATADNLLELQDNGATRLIIPDGIAIPRAGHELVSKDSSGEAEWVEPFWPAQQIVIYNDFMYWNNSEGSSPPFVESLASGASVGQSTTVSGATNHPGILRLSTNVADGRATVATANDQLVFRGGEIVFQASVNLSNVSTEADEFYFKIGLFPHLSSGRGTNGIFFEYDRTVGGDRWKGVSIAGGTATAVGTIAVAANTWYHLKFIATPSGSTTFYVNGSQLGIAGTNMPSDTIKHRVGVNIKKDVGAANRDANVDYIYYHKFFTTARQ